MYKTQKNLKTLEPLTTYPHGHGARLNCADEFGCSGTIRCRYY